VNTVEVSESTVSVNFNEHVACIIK